MGNANSTEYAPPREKKPKQTTQKTPHKKGMEEKGLAAKPPSQASGEE